MRFHLVIILISVILAVGVPNVAPAGASSVTINVNVGSSISNGRSISCSQGERLLRNRGFRDVRRIDCRGRYFVYSGWRSGTRFEVVLRQRDGQVVSRRRTSR